MTFRMGHKRLMLKPINGRKNNQPNDNQSLRFGHLFKVIATVTRPKWCLK